MQIVHPRSKSCIPGADCASQEQIVHPRSKFCIPGANCASWIRLVHPRCKLCHSSFSLALQMEQGRIPSAYIVKTLSLQVSGVTVDRVLSQRTWYQQRFGVTCKPQAQTRAAVHWKFLSNTCLSDTTSQLAQPHALLCA